MISEYEYHFFQGLLVLEEPFKTILDPATDGKGIMILGQVTKSLLLFALFHFDPGARYFWWWIRSQGELLWSNCPVQHVHKVLTDYFLLIFLSYPHPASWERLK